MQEVAAVNIPMKKSNDFPTLWCLVHNGRRVISLTAPVTRTWTSAKNTMLVGTETELRVEIKRLTLRPLEPVVEAIREPR